MPEMRKPKNYNRRFLVNVGMPDKPKWALIAAGITSRSIRIDETYDTYYYFDLRGAAEEDATEQKTEVSFTGHRVIGDAAQELVYDKLLYDINNRKVEFLDYDDGIDITAEPAPANGYKGTATLKISDTGSGDARNRQNITFVLSYSVPPVKGTVIEQNGEYTFTPAV